MKYRVEYELEGEWHVVGREVKARLPEQAVARACLNEGTYRVRSLDEDGYSMFWVPSFGPPVPMPNPGLQVP